MFEMAWRDGPIELDTWITNYAHHRYGSANADAARAWHILKDTVYTAPHRTRSIIDHVPTLNPAGGVPYDNVQLAGAWLYLLRAADELGDADTYRFDLVNIARQVLSNHAAALQRKVVEAHRGGDAKAFQAAADHFLQLMRDMDQLLATRSEFLLGRCLEDAKRWGDQRRRASQFRVECTAGVDALGPDDADRRLCAQGMGRDGRRVLSLPLEDLPRCGWCSLKQGRPFNAGAYHENLRQWMIQWSDQHETYPTTPRGDSLAMAKKLWAKYRHAFKPESPSLTTGRPTSCSTALPQHPARLANDGHADSTDRYWAMDTAKGDPAWWQVDLEKPTTVGRVVVVGYYGDNRHYGFTVETSLDGKKWQTVADRSDNTEPSTAKGYACHFTPQPLRYIRVTQAHNSANTGRHLVEVMAFSE